MNRITTTQKKWLLSLHILFSAIMFGVMIGFLILSLTAATTKDEGVFKACYTAMHILANTSVRASTIGSLITGILLSVLTSWGLFKFYWLIAKEALTLISIGLGIFGMYFWTLEAITITSSEGLNSFQNPTFTVNNAALWVGIILQIISLGAMFVISIFKPWGQRKLHKTVRT